MINELLQIKLHNAPALHSQHEPYYVTQGEGDILLLVHGSLCDLRYWRWQLQKLAQHFQVVSLSLPGYWPSNAFYMAGDFNLKNHCAAIADVIHATKQPNQKVHLLGHSRGAHIVTHYVLRYPNSINSVILADPAFTPYQAHQPLVVMDQAAHLIAANSEDEGLNLIIDAVSGPNTWRQMVGWFKDMIQDNSHTVIAQSRENLSTIGAAHLAALAQQPLLLIGGENSPLRYQHSIARLKTELPLANIVRIPNASHGMNLANPKAFNRAILDFLSLS